MCTSITSLLRILNCSIYQLCHIIFESCGVCDRCLFAWVNKSYSLGMEELSSDPVHPLGKGIFLLVPICIIAKNWTSKRRKMDTNLVHSPRFECALYEGVFFMNSCFEHPVMSDSCLSTVVIYDNLIFSLRVFESSKLSSDNSPCFWRSPQAYCQIDFFYFVWLKCLEHDIKCRFGFGDHDNPWSVFVYSVNERGFECEWTQFFSKIILYLCDEWELRCLKISGMDNSAGVFVDDQEITIFIDDIFLVESFFPGTGTHFVYRYLMSRKKHIFLVLHKELNTITLLKFVFIILPLSVHLYVVFSIELINKAQCRIWHELLQKLIQSLIGIICGDRELFHEICFVK